MEILTAAQSHAWDNYTIEHEPISSINLMERAALKCFDWLQDHGYIGSSFSIFCGKGNNGGDGLALARRLSEMGCPVTAYILEFGHKGTEDFQVNLARLHLTEVAIRFIQTDENFHPIPKGDIVIDALFGSGLNRPLNGVTAKLVEHINQSGNEVISIDIPSGLFVDQSSKGNPIICAKHTLSFQSYKPAMLMAENSQYIGEIEILDIGLDQGYLESLQNNTVLVDEGLIQKLLKPRNPFAHKGQFGHALLLAGSYGKMGAAILSAKACLRSGVGLLTCHMPTCGYEIMQGAVPEAMASTDDHEHILSGFKDDLQKYTVLGIGPGIGTDAQTSFFLEYLLTNCKKPMVLDADALNIISVNRKMFDEIPTFSILTPHPKEFERLFGSCENDFDRHELALENAKRYQCVIVLKGHNSFIATPDGKGYYNSTGNAGMAKGGSGDVLTGMVTAFLAQGYPADQAAILAVYLHGLAGDLVSKWQSQYSMIASDIIKCIGQAILSIDNNE